MKSPRFWLALAAFALVAGGASANDELIKLSKDPNQWAMPTGNYANWRYSELNQINKDNAKNLRPLWTFSTGVLRGHEGGPLVGRRAVEPELSAHIQNQKLPRQTD